MKNEAKRRQLIADLTAKKRWSDLKKVLVERREDLLDEFAEDRVLSAIQRANNHRFLADIQKFTADLGLDMQ
jgi:hypothetical protein